MRRPTVYVALAGVSALIAAIIVYSALKKREAEVQEAMVKSVEIVVAARDLPLGIENRPEFVKLARWSRDSVPPGAFTDHRHPDERLRQGFLRQQRADVGDKLFTGAKTAGVMPLLIPAGMRAMSVPVDEVSDIAGFVLPHTKVDVLVVGSRRAARNERPFSKIVLQNVEVLAVAQEIEHTQGPAAAGQGRDCAGHVRMRPSGSPWPRAKAPCTWRCAITTISKIVLTNGADIPAMLHAFNAQAEAVPVVTVQHGRVIHSFAPRQQPIQVQIMRDGKSARIAFVRQASVARKRRRRLLAAARERIRAA